MKSTGIVRFLDSLGRIVIPMEIRKTQDIKNHEPMEIYMEGDYIIIKKFQPDQCVLCGNHETAAILNGKKLCDDCVRKIKDNLYTLDEKKVNS